MMNRRTPALAVLAATLAVGSGCYSYIPATPQQPQPGTDVRAYLTATGSETLVPRFGPGVTELGGLLLEQQNDSLSLLISWYKSTRAGDIMSGGNEAVRLPFDQIQALEQKRLSKGKSLLLGAAFAAGAIIAARIVTDDDRATDDEDDEDPGPTDIVVPLSRIFRIPFVMR